MNEYLLVGIVGISIHFLIVALVYIVARSQGRKDPIAWAIAANLAGPFALLFLYLWRGDSGAPGRTKAPLGDPAEERAGPRVP